MSFSEFAFHLHTNTIGPIICAQRLLKTRIPIGTIVFMSSDSGSAQNFREMEDGYILLRRHALDPDTDRISLALLLTLRQKLL